MIDRFRDALLKKENGPGGKLNINFGPPPEDLIKKTAIDDEPVKSGAGIAFIRFNRLMGRERVEKLNPDNKQRGGDNPQNAGNPQGGPNSSDITAASNISDYILNAKDATRLVYCRFGEKYL